jgi:hypothetical protein
MQLRVIEFIERSNQKTNMIKCNTPWLLYFEPLCRKGASMVVRCSTTYVIRLYDHLSCEFKSHSGEVHSIQHYVIKLVSDLRQVSGFLLVTWFPPPVNFSIQLNLAISNSIGLLQISRHPKFDSYFPNSLNLTNNLKYNSSLTW